MILKEITRVTLDLTNPEEIGWIDKLERADHWHLVGKGAASVARTYEAVTVVFNADEVLREMFEGGG